MKKRLLLIFLIVCINILFVGCSDGENESGKIAVKINNQSISESEFLIYLLETQKNFEDIGGKDIWETDFEGQTAENVAKESAFNTLKTVKISSQKSKDLNIELSEEDILNVEKEAEDTVKDLTESEKSNILNYNQVVLDVMKDKALYKKVYESLTKDYVISEPDFKTFFEKNKDDFRDKYTSLKLRSIHTDSSKEAEEISQKIKEGTKFDELSSKYNIDGKYSKGGKYEAFKGNLDSAFGISFDINENEVTDVLEAYDGYYIFMLEGKEVPDDKKLEDYGKNVYIENTKKQIFEQEYAKWLNNSSVEKNDEVWENIHLIK